MVQWYIDVKLVRRRKGHTGRAVWLAKILKVSLCWFLTISIAGWPPHGLVLV